MTTASGAIAKSGGCRGRFLLGPPRGAVDNLSPQELDELQRLSAPGSLRRYLAALREARQMVACGEVGVAAIVSFGIAKGHRLTSDLEYRVEPTKQAHQPPVLAARSALGAGGESALRPPRP